MSAATVFQIHLILGYVPWLLCFAAYVWPGLKSMDPVEAQRAIAYFAQLPLLRAGRHYSGCGWSQSAGGLR